MLLHEGEESKQVGTEVAEELLGQEVEFVEVIVVELPPHMQQVVEDVVYLVDMDKMAAF